MSTAAWMRRQRDRPITQHERRSAMATVIVSLAAATLLLTLTQPSSQANRADAHTGQRTQTARPATIDPSPLALTPETARTADRFLAGYLGYAYGHTPARQITGASRSLVLSLKSHPPRVPPAARARHPRVLSLHPVAAPVGEIAVTAIVNDGGLIDYPVGLVLAPDHGHLLVTRLEGE